MPDDTPAWRAWLKWSLFFALVMAIGIVELVIGAAGLGAGDVDHAEWCESEAMGRGGAT